MSGASRQSFQQALKRESPVGGRIRDRAISFKRREDDDDHDDDEDDEESRATTGMTITSCYAQ